MAALCSVTAIIATVIPFAHGLGVLGTVPMGLLAYRFRPRVLIAAAVAATVLAFLISGLGSSAMVVDAAWVGGICGIVKRKGRGAPTVLAASLITGVIWGSVWVGIFAMLTRLRELIFGVLTANVNGVCTFLVWVHLPEVAAALKHWVAEGLRVWPWLVLPYLVFVVVMVTMIGWWALSRLLERMGDIPDVHKLDPPETDVALDGPIDPVPVRLDHVRFRYPNAVQDALRELSLEISSGEHVAITGANGSGKTTLMLILAGRQPTSGTVHRPGAVGLGKHGGTALVLQHPKSQVLGTRVADDVVWGLPPDVHVDVPRLLREVGLEDLADRDTASLSGGQLQRLALAAALAREPALLIADEVTSMIDQQGRDGLLDVISGLHQRHRTALVHITHFDNEAASADRTINLSDSDDNAGHVGNADTEPSSVAGQQRAAGTIELINVGHEYASGTPWAKTALRDINLVAQQGDGVLIHGHNGSGKSTLGWIMAGLTVPTAGRCLIDGEPTDEHVGEVALAFQTARLQLMRSHVDLEVASAAGFSPRDTDRVAAALGLVGLHPALAERRIDQLSGGQMRRVVLAGLLARSPRVLILDEPLAGLDVGSQRGLLRLLERLRREQGLTLIVISHDSAGLKDVCPRTLHLRDGVLSAASTSSRGVS
ncbi:ATP-binding cassette domain-containing protein [Mycobacterium tilburgii]|uniref:ATP-binding cassette domain-containing protein n=1 Tax=Mycobacterium tilburgii TaxID=44467 RepID=UPI00118433E2|nr:ATP-binding cassette domain-containing protein [Mycobacterium tilburgii]